MKMSRRQLRKLIFEVLEGEAKVKVTKQKMGNIEQTTQNKQLASD